MKLYAVIHNYDVDGGFGDAIPKEDIIVITDTKEKALNFIKYYSNPHVYEIPYQKMNCGLLTYKEYELNKVDQDIDLFWMRKGGTPYDKRL